MLSSLKPRGSPKYNPLISSLIIMISRLLIYSLFNDDEFANSGKEIIGLILIKRFDSFLKLSNPDSGFFSFGKISYLIPPTAPSRTASDSFTLIFVSSG